MPFSQIIAAYLHILEQNHAQKKKKKTMLKDEVIKISLEHFAERNVEHDFKIFDLVPREKKSFY